MEQERHARTKRPISFLFPFTRGYFDELNIEQLHAQVADNADRGEAGPEVLRFLSHALEEDHVDLSELFFYHAEDASPEQGILDEFDADGTGTLDRDEFLVLADLITRAFEHWENSQMEMFGDYRLGRMLGNGSSGIVRYATNVKTKQKFAIKMIPKGNCAYMSKLDQEINALKLLRDHENVVKLEEVSRFSFLLPELYQSRTSLSNKSHLEQLSHGA